MSEPIVTTLNVAFNGDEGVGDQAGKNKIVLQQMTKRFDYAGQLWARCFPSRGVQFTTSVGMVTPGEVRSQNISEGLKFSNSATASLKFPGVSNVEITPHVLMKKVKDAYGNIRIVPASDIELVYDADTETVIAQNRSGVQTAIYGAAFARYTAFYQMLYYEPGQVNVPVGGGNYAVTFSTGTIFGYNDYDVQTLDMELDLSSSKDWVEYARVTSKIVLDAKGVWEFPPNWESTYQNNKEKTGEQRDDYPEPGQFPGFIDEIDQDNSFVDVRIHEIIEVNTIGSLRYLTQNGDRIYAPYWGNQNSNATYTPKYEVKFGDPPGGKKASSADEFRYDLNNSTWRDVFLSVDKAEVLADLQDTYPGVTEA
jgi:hypothetical protein